MKNREKLAFEIMKSNHRLYVLFLITLLCTLIAACDSDNLTDPEKMDVSDKGLSGGETTVFDATSHAFSTPAPNLSADGLAKHLEGDVEFEAVFITVPAEVNPGLGPVYNNISCINCHARDGRGRAPTSGEKLTSMLFRVSLPNPEGDGTQGPVPVPGFGTQLNNRAIFGVPPEGTVTINYTEGEFTTSDGTKVHLRTPSYKIEDAYQPLPDDVEISPRVAPVVFGLGLLEAIPEATILALADEDDQDGDGISGKANYVWDVQKNGLSLGRFGWKANQPTLLQQVASAYHDDMGITTSLLPRENSDGQSQYDGRGDDPELSDEILDVVTFYVQTLAVPARRDLDDPMVQNGEELFETRAVFRLPYPDLTNRDISGCTGGFQPDDSTVHRPAVARHGTGAGRQSPRFPSDRVRVAYTAAVGYRIGQSGQRAHQLSPRRSGERVTGGDSVARWGSGAIA